MNGFAIRCLRCGTEMTISLGKRDYDAEPIKFGIDLITEGQWIRCKCGHKLTSEDRFEPEDGDIDEKKWFEYWVVESKKFPDESTAYGIDCRDGRCGM